MIEFISDNGKVELKYYDPDATLAELATELEIFRSTCDLKTSKCKGCGECCSDNIPVLGLDISPLLEGLGMSFEQAVQSVLVLPDKPDMAFRSKAIREMASATSITPLEATLLFEYNNAEPIILTKQVQHPPVCCFLHENLCSRYTIRPYSCGLYLCNMDQHLSYLQEMVIRQGTWHAYYKLGWVAAEDISHNPFLKADSYDKLPIADFDYNFENALEQLFFYF